MKRALLRLSKRAWLAIGAVVVLITGVIAGYFTGKHFAENKARKDREELSSKIYEERKRVGGTTMGNENQITQGKTMVFDFGK